MSSFGPTLSFAFGQFPVEDVVDFSLRFYLWHPAFFRQSWLNLIESGTSSEGQRWTPPEGLPLKAHQGVLQVDPAYDLYITQFATSSRALELRVLQDVFDVSHAWRPFSGPALHNNNGFMLIQPVVTQGGKSLCLQGSTGMHGPFASEAIHVDAICILTRHRRDPELTKEDLCS